MAVKAVINKVIVNMLQNKNSYIGMPVMVLNHRYAIKVDIKLKKGTWLFDIINVRHY